MTDLQLVTLLVSVAWLCTGQAVMLHKADSVTQLLEEVRELGVPIIPVLLAMTWLIGILVWPFMLFGRNLKKKETQ